MTRHPLFGICLALFGALLITPDTLLMRLSQMGGGQMAAWRGLLMGTALLLAWLVFRRRQLSRDLRAIACGAGLLVIVCQALNGLLFAIAIASAPVPVVLFSVATVPVFAALLSWAILREATHWSTWLATAAVLSGIGLAVFGKAEGAVVGSPMVGAVAGLTVAFCLALNFVTIRRSPQLPVLLGVGAGAFLAGSTALMWMGTSGILAGHVWAIAIAGGVILPASFFSLALASRYTHASNVSLLMLLEAILGPVWVWAGTGEAMTTPMLIGGAVVIVSLILYLWYAGRRQARARRLATAQGAGGLRVMAE